MGLFSRKKGERTVNRETTPTRVLEQVATLEGDGERQSDVFELTGAPAKLTFAVKGADKVTDIPAAYVLREDEALGVTGGKPAAACFGDRLSDDRDLSRSPGRYYVHVVAGDATSWSVVIEQER